MIHKNKIEAFEKIEHNVDLCVVGGGLAGMCASIAAARNGSKVLLMQDRPVLGGNASSEIRMWIRGAHGPYNKETGILSEIELENIYRNPNMNYSIFDSILYEKVRFEDNIELLLNCSCCDAMMDDDTIISVTGWQTTTQKWHEVKATLFADCSGDSVLAPLTGAEFRMGRESSEEFGEDIAPKVSDEKTMGMSCLIQGKEMPHKVEFKAPKWANKYTKDDFYRKMNFSTKTKWTEDNFWWMELGGMDNSIDDTEVLRDELLKVAFGAWDFIKNSGEVEADCWDLDWVGFLPGKRESRRYVGDYIMTQHDVRSEGKFDDLVAYGGWTMDDHNPKGFASTEPPTIFHPAPSPYGIPYRTMYSKNISNLMFAGRNISVTHSALSSCRVMATCAVIGQAVGTAAAIAIQYKMSPREVYEKKMQELKQTLMDNDCYLPFNKRVSSSLILNSTIYAGAQSEVLINGYERSFEEESNVWVGTLNEEIEIDFKEKTKISGVRFVFDSDLSRNCYNDYPWYTKMFSMRCNTRLDEKCLPVPPTLLKVFEIYSWTEETGWELIHSEANNYQRLYKVPVNVVCQKLKIIPQETWGEQKARIYAIDIL